MALFSDPFLLLLDPFSPSRHDDGFRLNQRLSRTFTFTDGDTPRTVTLSYNRDNSFDATVATASGTETFSGVTGALQGNGHVLFEINGERIKGTVVRKGDDVHVFAPGDRAIVTLPPPSFLNDTSAAGLNSVLTPMPCKITQVMVKAGDKVVKDQPLVVLEAMKMEVRKGDMLVMCVIW